MNAGPTLLPRTVASQLYLACALAGLAALSIATSSLHFTHRTGVVVEKFHSEAMPGLMIAADLALLVERHRRIVETAPVSMDRQEIDRDRQQSESILERIEELVGVQQAEELDFIRSELPDLRERSRKVLFLAANYAQQRSMDEADSYSSTARRVDAAIGAYRAARLAAAEQDVTEIRSGGRVLMMWVIAALVAIGIVLPAAVLLMRGTVLRLRRITRAMFRLTRNETDLGALPSSDLDEVGDMARAVTVFRDNAVQLNQQRAALVALNQRLDIALANMSHGLSMFDAERRLVVSNGRYAAIYDLPPGLLAPGTCFAEIVTHYCKTGDGPSRAELVAWCEDFADRIAASGGFTETRRLLDGRLIAITYRPIEGGGWVDVHEDITEKRKAEERIARLACEDTLTGIGNRHAFREKIREKITARHDEPFAIHWIDLDRFKEVNDVHGHPAGDALLVAVAERIQAAVRSTDFVARLGGDEFAVIQCQAPSWTEAEPLAMRLVEVIGASYMIDGHALSIGASIGVALSADLVAEDPEVLLHNADVALYEAKAAGRGTHVLFRSEIEKQIRDRRRLEHELRGALVGGEFELQYQPIIDIASREVCCCEALLRWQHPVRGPVSPAVFIPLLEELGLISEVGAWVLDRACAEAAGWPAGVGVAVNLSASQFNTAELLEATEQALARSGLEPGRLELEVTESLLLKDRTETHAALHKLRDLGVGIALDDFGTGYASLSYLRSFPFDKIKIDQTFVRELPERPECLAIVTAVCDMARSLDMRTVAEGVETAEHMAWVERAGCNELQGYHFSRPVSATEILDVIAHCGRRLHKAA